MLEESEIQKAASPCEKTAGQPMPCLLDTVVCDAWRFKRTGCEDEEAVQEKDSDRVGDVEFSGNLHLAPMREPAPRPTASPMM